MRGATLFSGIGAPECAAPEIDWRWAAEIDPFASSVLAARFPTTVNHGDVTRIDPDAVEPVDLVVFGSPCQSFSVAGKRLGLDDPRGNMALVGLRLVGRIRPRWVVFENVPGLLSSDGGRDFGAFLGALGQCGYGFAYRILDAQHFGVPQRRRRVFVVGCLGDWRPAAAVLFEPESLRGDTAPSREAREGVARPIEGCPEGGSGWRADADTADNLIAFDARNGTLDEGTTIPVQAGGHGQSPNTLPLAFGGNNTAGEIAVSTAINAHGGPHGRLDFETETFVTHSLRADGFDASEDGTGRGTPLVAWGISSDAIDRSGEGDGSAGERAGLGIVADGAPAIRARPNNSVAFAQNSRDELREMPYVGAQSAEPGMKQTTYMRSAMSVRRLTPRECERLQGFPDDFTTISYRGKPAADGPRYRALGNSMAVPVVRWLLERLRAVDAALARKVA